MFGVEIVFAFDTYATDDYTITDILYPYNHQSDYILLSNNAGVLTGTGRLGDQSTVPVVIDTTILSDYIKVTIGTTTAWTSYANTGAYALVIAAGQPQFRDYNGFLGGLPVINTNGETIHATLQFMGDPGWLALNGGEGGGGGGDSGVDAGDWDYWFDSEIGKFHDLNNGLVAYFGDGQTDGQVATDMASILQKLDILAYALSSPVPPVNSAFTVNDLDASLTEWNLDTKRADIEEQFSPLSITGTDSIEEAVSITLPFSSWLAFFDSGIQDMTFTVQTGPFDLVRTPLHIIIYALLSVWAILIVFNEFRRYA